jgi:hypothetical protein
MDMINYNIITGGFGTSTDDYKKLYIFSWYNYMPKMYISITGKIIRISLVVGLSIGRINHAKIRQKEFSEDAEYPISGVVR